MESFTVAKQILDDVRALLYRKTGIHLDRNKDTLIVNRIRKLAKDININDPRLLFEEISKGKNIQEFINAFTTNKTDFFREGFHFLDIIDRVALNLCRNSQGIKVFCSASSTGEEPYSIAATLLHAKALYGLTNFPISIVATDIDTEVLEFAKKGIYKINTKISPLPTWIDLEEFFVITPLPDNHIQMEAKPTLKSLITFKQLNLYAESYPFGSNEFDIIFCRNVLIYFKVEDQERILEKLFKYLKENGTLYLGHSENILSLSNRVERLGQNTFIKISG